MWWGVVSELDVWTVECCITYELFTALKKSQIDLRTYYDKKLKKQNTDAVLLIYIRMNQFATAEQYWVLSIDTTTINSRLCRLDLDDAMCGGGDGADTRTSMVGTKLGSK